MAEHLKGYYLTWKTKGTKWNRVLFQLAVSEHGTDESGFGLLATPNTMDHMKPKDEEMTKNHPSRPGRTKSGNLREQIAYDQVLLPTPTTFYTREDWTIEQIKERQEQVKQETLEKGKHHTENGFGMNLAQAAKLLPTATATATAYKGWSKNHNRADTDDRIDYTIEREAYEQGNTGRLNPEWVEWLMGYPIGWTELKD